MDTEDIHRYWHGVPEYLFLVATLLLLPTFAWLATYSIKRDGLLDSLIAIIVLLVMAALPVVPLKDMLDLSISDDRIGKRFARVSMGSIHWSRVVDAVQSDVFHPGYGRVVRVYQLRTRAGSFLPTLTFLDTIDGVDSLLVKVNRSLCGQGVPIWHRNDTGRTRVAGFTPRTSLSPHG